MLCLSVCSSRFTSSDQHVLHFGIREVDDDTVLGDYEPLLVCLGCGTEGGYFQCPWQDGCAQVPAGSPWPTCKCQTCHSTGNQVWMESRRWGPWIVFRRRLVTWFGRSLQLTLCGNILRSGWCHGNGWHRNRWAVDWCSWAGVWTPTVFFGAQLDISSGSSKTWKPSQRLQGYSSNSILQFWNCSGYPWMILFWNFNPRFLATTSSHIWGIHSASWDCYRDVQPELWTFVTDLCELFFQSRRTYSSAAVGVLRSGSEWKMVGTKALDIRQFSACCVNVNQVASLQWDAFATFQGTWDISVLPYSFTPARFWGMCSLGDSTTSRATFWP